MAISVHEMMSAVHSWLRTVELFMGYLRFIRATERRAGVGNRAKDTFVESLSAGEPPPKVTQWNTEDSLLREILIKAQATSPFSVAKLREQIKNKARWRNQPGLDLAAKLASCAEKLSGLALLKPACAPQEDAGKKKTSWYAQAAWRDLGEEGKKEVTRLELSRDHFA